MNETDDLVNRAESAEKVLKKELIETSMLIAGIIILIWVAFIGIADNMLIVMALAVNVALIGAMFMGYRNIERANVKILSAVVGGLLLAVVMGLSRLLDLETLVLIKMPLEIILLMLGCGIAILLLMLANLFISWNTLRKIKNQQQNAACTKG